MQTPARLGLKTADDRDQTVVHVSLAVKAPFEARTLMLASNNVLFPSNGEPSIVR